ncbi:MAG TPA: stage III sporulation protein AC [Pseudogracilibacillus sp.]|nr:stage III sporulation protein AC [Pseudogracilibacillus sp.]
MLDSSLIFQIASIGIITALLYTILKELNKEAIAQFISLLGFIIVLYIVIQQLAKLFQEIETMFLLGLY